MRLLNGVKLVRCPAEYLDNFGCGQCGGDDGPLCARLDRTFAILFTAHGASKKAAGDPDKKRRMLCGRRQRKHALAKYAKSDSR